MPAFNIQNSSLLEDVFQETINKTTKKIANIMVMKWDTHIFCKVPPFDVLHH